MESALHVPIRSTIPDVPTVVDGSAQKQPRRIEPQSQFHAVVFQLRSNALQAIWKALATHIPIASRFVPPVSITNTSMPSRCATQQASYLNIRSFGAQSEGAALYTMAISKAIAAANAAGGGTVVFPPGVYLSGTLEFMSNVTLELQAGAVLQASPRLANYGSISDYGFGRNYGIDSSGEGSRSDLSSLAEPKTLQLRDTAELTVMVTLFST
jgi:hypothetical protein